MSAYLIGNIIFAVVWISFFFIFPISQKRKMQIVGSLTLLPFALLDIWFQPDYWHPPILIKAIEPLSLETVIYCFTAGGIVAAVGSFFISNKMTEIKWSKVLDFFIFSLGLFAIFTLGKISNAMNNLNFAFLIIFIFIFLVKPRQNYKAIYPAIIFAAFTILAINLARLFYPNFVEEYWNLSNLWPTFLNTPTEEIFFAAVLGALWSVLPQYIFKGETK